MRAPSIYNELIKVASKSNTTLSDFVTGERYLNTGGADGFFILTDVSDTGSDLMKATIRSKEGKAWGNPEFLIESQFLMPGFRSTDSTKLRVEMPDCHVLVIPEDVDVSSYEVSKYLAWGEQAGFNERSVTRTRSPWWRPQPQSKSGAPILWPRTHAETHKCYYNPDELVSLRFFRLHPKSKKQTLPVLAILNSTVFALLKEIHGRRGLGQGALETGLVDIMPLPFIDLNGSISETLSEAVKPLLRREIRKLSEEISYSDRRYLDETVMEAYGLNHTSVSSLYDSVIELVSQRLSKSKTFATK